MPGERSPHKRKAMVYGSRIVIGGVEVAHMTPLEQHVVAFLVASDGMRMRAVMELIPIFLICDPNTPTILPDRIFFLSLFHILFIYLYDINKSKC